jgi:hypothetical protein
MSKNCIDCRHFRDLLRPWKSSETKTTWECLASQKDPIMAKLDLFITGLTWVGDVDNPVHLQFKAVAKECRKYEGRNCQQCKHFHQEPANDPTNLSGYEPFDWSWTCKLDMVTEISEDPFNPHYAFGNIFDTEEQGQRYFAKRCEEYDAED